MNFAIPDMMTQMSPPQDIDGLNEEFGGDVAMYNDGSYDVVYTKQSKLYVQYYDVRRNAIDAPVEIASGLPSSSRIAVRDGRNAAVVYALADSSGVETIYYKLLRNGVVSKSGQVSVSDGRNRRSPEIAMDARGNFVVAYEQAFSFGDDDILYAYFDASGNSLVSETRVAGASTIAREIEPAVALSKDGTTMAVGWRYYKTGSEQAALFSMYRASGTTWNNITEARAVSKLVVQPNAYRNLELAMANNGDMVAAWIEADGHSNYTSLNYSKISRLGEVDDPVTETYATDGMTFDELDVTTGKYLRDGFALVYSTTYTGDTDWFLTFPGSAGAQGQIDDAVDETRPFLASSGSAHVVSYYDRRSMGGSIINNVRTVTYGIGLGDGVVDTQVLGYIPQNGQVWLSSSSERSSDDFVSSLVGQYDPSLGWTSQIVGQFSNADSQSFAARNARGEWWLTDAEGQWNFGVWSSLVSWLDVQRINIDNDVHDEIIGRTNGGQWWVADPDPVARKFNHRFFGAWSGAVTWADVQVGDFNGDGLDDVAGRLNSNGQLWLGLNSSGTFTNVLAGAWSSAVQWQDVRVGDFNGDDSLDLIGRANGQWWVSSFNGTQFITKLWGTWSNAVTWTDVMVGDFNGDGLDDVVGRILNTGAFWTAFNDGNRFTSVNTLNMQSTNISPVHVFDVNGDGRDDLLVRSASSGVWLIGISDGTKLKTYRFGRWSTGVNWSFTTAGYLVY